MTEKIRGLVLNVRKYNDRNCIVTLYTPNHGRLSFISPVGAGKASNARRARLQPLALISTELHFKPGSELQHLRAFSVDEVRADLYFHPLKRTLALFISEFLYRLLNASLPDPPLFEFLCDAIRLLDQSREKISDFHIPLLISLLPFAGIQPDIAGYRPGKVLDFHTGTFLYPEDTSGPHISPEESAFVPAILKINFSNIKRLRLTNANRRQILYALLNYYAYHIPGIGSLKSIEVLREVFG